MKKKMFSLIQPNSPGRHVLFVFFHLFFSFLKRCAMRKRLLAFHDQTPATSVFMDNHIFLRLCQLWSVALGQKLSHWKVVFLVFSLAF